MAAPEAKEKLPPPVITSVAAKVRPVLLFTVMAPVSTKLPSSKMLPDVFRAVAFRATPL
jgi:hypothetical protein